jgi:hypothetical protein
MGRGKRREGNVGVLARETRTHVAVPLSDSKTRKRLLPTGDLSQPEAEPVRHPIPAELHADDGGATANFDAAAFFEQASDEDLVELGKLQWESSYESDAIAEFMNGKDQGVTDVYDYREQHPQQLNGDTNGFDVHLDAAAAEAWLEANRPHLFPWINHEVNFATPRYQVIATEFISGGSSQGCEWQIRISATDELVATLHEDSGADEAFAIEYVKALEANMPLPELEQPL